MGHQKIVHKRHTGKVVHHRHTSYGWLMVVVLLAVVPLVLASRTVVLAAADPVERSETVHAVVSAPIPDTAPVILIPANGAVLSKGDAVQISGTCPSDTLLKIYKNDVLAGATFCQNNRFSLTIDLFIGVNTLIVRAYNASDMPGPESSAVAVRNQVGGDSAGQTATTTDQFYMTSDIRYSGVKVGDKLSWPLTLNGGQAPYAVSVGWGDGEVDLISRTSSGTFSIEHVYKAAPTNDKSSYDVTITATDQSGNKSFMQLVTIVGGEKMGLAASVKQGYDISSYIRYAWQLMVLVIVIVVSFWLGERRELRLLRKQMKTV